MRRSSASPRYSLLAVFVCLACNVAAQQPSQHYTGVVTDTRGQPLKNARVHIHGRQQYVYADAHGRFSIQAPPHAELHISAAGYGDRFITLTPAQPELNINLTAGGIERIVVAASGIHKYNLEMASPASVLTGEDLSRRTEPTIGETLKYEPGVHANYYGPVASSPVIRGLDGPRVRILNNGLDTNDVSRIGPDHAISADAITAQQIEVLRGPATLLYGSGAIGGVVNVVDNRIPRQLRSSSETKLETRYVDVSDEKTLALNHEGSSDNIAWHLDGFNRDNSDYQVPRFSNDAATSTNRLENSWSQSQALNGGVSYIGERALFGISIGQFNADYGIPAHHHEAEHAEDSSNEHADDAAVFARLKQHRVSLAGEWYTPFDGIETLAFNTAYTDYLHHEIEAGAIGTTFKNQALEGRITLEHEAIGGWHGIVGYHFQHTDYRAVGEEAFTPDSKTVTHALFVLEEKQFGNLSAQLGGRIERVKHDAGAVTASHDAALVSAISDRSAAASASAGVVWEFVPGFSWALALSRSERTPGAAELYSNGTHIATSSYELGLRYQLHNGGLELSEHKAEKETANNVDLTFRSFNNDLSFTCNFFYNKVHNYLYLADTGLTMDDLHAGHADDAAAADHRHDSFALYQYQQQDATLYGAEFEARYQLDPAQALNVFFDAVRAKLDGGSYLPRIPPYKTGLGYQYKGISWSADLDITRYAKQDKVALNETVTKAYTLLDASVNYDFNWSKADMTVFLRGTNLTNELGFVHSSFIKHDAPLPGRAVTFGIRATF